MEEYFTRVGEDLAGRLTGPMTFRLILQPLVACILGARAGLRDVHEGKPPLLWALAFHPNRRGPLLREFWKHAGRVFLLGMFLDAIYQIMVLRTVYVGEAVVVAIALVVIPYAVVRASVRRLLGSSKQDMREQVDARTE